MRGHQRVQYRRAGRRTETGPRQGDHQIGGRQPVEAVLDRERHAEVGGNRPGPLGAQDEVEAGHPLPVRAEDLGDDPDGEHADTGRDVRGDGLERGHGGSLPPC